MKSNKVSPISFSLKIFSCRNRCDTSQSNKKMTKDVNDHLHYEKSSQHTSEDLIRGRNGQRSEHLMFFKLVFLIIRICCK